MAADKFSLFHCLTETGWLAIAEDEIPPSGWVRTYEEVVEQGSPFGREGRHWQRPKTNPSWSEEEADLLERRFPRPVPPRKLSPKSLKALGL